MGVEDLTEKALPPAARSSVTRCAAGTAAIWMTVLYHLGFWHQTLACCFRHRPRPQIRANG